MSKTKSSAVNFRRMHVEYPEWMNGFNMRNIKGYWYQYHDMEVLGSYIIDQVVQKGEEFGGEQPVVFAAPFGEEYNSEEPGKERSKITQIEQLRKFTSDLLEDKRIVGTYCLDASDGKALAGNHWIAYCLERNSTTGEIRCVYKDSSDRDMKDFEDVIKEAFGGDVSAITGIRGGEGYLPVVPSPVTVGGAGAGSEEAKDGEDKLDVSVIRLDKGNKEQKDGSSCGLFALKNMEILARANIDALIHTSGDRTMEDLTSSSITASSSPLVEGVMSSTGIYSSDTLSFYKPDADELLSLRHYFSEVYVRGVVSGRLEEVLRRNLVDSHKEEARRLESELKGHGKLGLRTDIASTITKIETIHNTETDVGYSFQIKCIGLSAIDRGKEALINQLSRNIVDSKEHIRVIENGVGSFSEIRVVINPEHIKPATMRSIFDTSIGGRAIAPSTDRNWREDPDLLLTSDQKQQLLRNLVLELRPFSRDDLKVLEEVCASNSKIGDEVVGLLIQSEHHKTFLHIAAESGDVELLQAMLMAGESANRALIEEGKQTTPLELVCKILEVLPEQARDEENYQQVVDLLLDNGAKSGVLKELSHKKLVADRILKKAQEYTDSKVEEVRVDLERLHHEFDSHIASIPAGTKEQWARERIREDRLEKVVREIARELYSIEEGGVVVTDISESKITACREIIGSFSKYLQSQIRTTLEGTVTAASGLVSTSASSSIINEALGNVPYVGFILKAQAQIMQNKQSKIWLKEQADHIVSGAHQDSIIADYVSHVADYCGTKIVLETMKKMSEKSARSGFVEVGRETINDLVSNIVSISSSAASDAEETFLSSIVNKFENFFFEKRGSPATIPDEWREIAGKYVTGFMDYLFNHHVDHNRSDKLGEDIAKEVLPVWAIDDEEQAGEVVVPVVAERVSVGSKLDKGAKGFSVKNAATLAELSTLIYSDKEEIGRVVGHKWGYKDYNIIGEGDHLAKDLRAIVIKEGSDMIITFCSINDGASLQKALSPRSETINVATCIDTTISGATPVPIMKKLQVHKGFLGAASELWEMEGGIKSIISSYIETEIKSSGSLGNIYISGHSVGGSIAQATYLKIATILREMISKGQLDKKVSDEIHDKIVVYTYGQPKLLKQSSTKSWDELQARHYRVVNDDDVIAKLPSEAVMKFKHVGSEYHIGGVKVRGESDSDVIVRIGSKIKVTEAEAVSGDGLDTHIIKAVKSIFKNVGKLLSDPNAKHWLSSASIEPSQQAHDMSSYYKRLDEFSRIEDRRTMTVPSKKTGGDGTSFMTMDESVYAMTGISEGDKLKPIAPTSPISSPSVSESLGAGSLSTEARVIPSESTSKSEDIQEIIKCGYIEGIREYLAREDCMKGYLIEYAIRYSQVEILKFLASDDRLDLPEIHRAAILGDIARLESEVTRTNIDEKYKGFLTPLMFSSFSGNIDIVDRLLKKGADVNTENKDGQTALHMAARCGSIEMVKYLQSQGADVNAENKYGKTALHTAASAGHLEMVKYLQSQGADTNTSVGYRKETLLLIAAEGGHLEMVKYLQSQGADINARGGYFNETVLHCAVKSGNFEMVKYLQSQGADVNAKDNDGQTALHMAARCGSIEMVKYLQSQGADINARGGYFNETVLHCAAKSGNFEMVKYLQSQGADVNAENKDGQTALHTAADSGNLEMVKYLQSQGLNVNAKDKDGKTALHTAASAGHLEMVKYLQSQGADINARGGYFNETVLHCAAKSGNFEMVKYLQSQGADVNAENKDGRTALHTAASAGHLEMVKYLQSQGADVNAKDNDGQTALHMAASAGHLEMVKYLQSQGADINARGGYFNETVLHCAAKSGNFEMVKYLQSQGADVNAENKDGRTALHTAASAGHLEMVKYLQSQGANVNAENKDGQTALHTAASAGHLEMVKYLQSQGANVNAENKDGQTALHMAASAGHLEMVKYLQSQGADINARGGYFNETVLHCAAKSGHFEMVKYLQSQGLNVNAKDKDGKTALHTAASAGHLEMVKYLQSQRLNVNAKDKDGQTALHTAADSGNLEMVKYLQSQGLNVNAKDKDGQTALHIATRCGSIEMVKFLLSHGADVNARNAGYNNSSGVTALDEAIEKGNAELVRILIVDGGPRPNKWMLDKAVEKGNAALVMVLITDGGLKPEAKVLQLFLNCYNTEFVKTFVKDTIRPDREFIERFKLTAEKDISSKELGEMVIILENELYARKSTIAVERFDDAKKTLNTGVYTLTLKDDFAAGTENGILRLDLPKVTQILRKAPEYAEIVAQIRPAYDLLDSKKLVGKLSSIFVSKKYASQDVSAEHPVFEEIKSLKSKISVAMVATFQEIRKLFDIKPTLDYVRQIEKDKISKTLDETEYRYLLIDEFDVGIGKILNDLHLSVDEANAVLSAALHMSKSELKSKGQKLEFYLKAVWSLDAISKYYDTYMNKFIEIYGEAYKAKDEFKKSGSKSFEVDEKAYIKAVAKVIEKKLPIPKVDIIKEDGEVYYTPDDGAEVDIFFDVSNPKSSSVIRDVTSAGETPIVAVGGAGAATPVYAASRVVPSKASIKDALHAKIIKAYLDPTSGLKVSLPTVEGQAFGKHAVVSFHGVHYKYWPYAPSIEFTVNSFNKILLEDISLPTMLVKIIGRGAKNFGQVALYQAARTIDGENFHYLLERPDFIPLIDKKSFSALFISSLLTGAGDAKPDNFMVRLINDSSGSVSDVVLLGVDNDISFCRGNLGFRRVGNKGKISSDMANILFFLPQMDEPLDSSIIRELAAYVTKPIEIVSSWIAALYEQNQQYIRMIESGYLTAEEANLLKLPIKLPAGTVQKLYTRLVQITDMLKCHEAVTPNEIFRELYPGIAYYYEQKRNIGRDDIVSSIKQVYADTTDDEVLAKELLSSSKLKDNAVLQTISSTKMKSHKEFVTIFNATPEELAMEFFAQVDFASDMMKGGHGERACKIIGSKLKFLQEIRLRNINVEQLGLLLQEWVSDDKDGRKKTADGVLVNKLVIISDRPESAEASYSLFDEIAGSTIEDDLKILGIDQAKGTFTYIRHELSQEEINLIEHTGESGSDFSSISDLSASPISQSTRGDVRVVCAKLAKDFGDLLEMAGSERMEREQMIQFAKLLRDVQTSIKIIDATILKQMLNPPIEVRPATEIELVELSYLDQLIAMLLERKQLSVIMVELINKGVIEGDDINTHDSFSLLHTLALHPKWLQYSELTSTIAHKFPHHLELKYKDEKLVADIIKDRIEATGRGHELLAMLLNAGSKLTSPSSEEELMVRGVELGLLVSDKELKEGIYDHSKRIATEETLLHLAIRSGDIALFKSTFGSYELYEATTEFTELTKLLPELFELSIDIRGGHKRQAEIIEIIYDKIDSDHRPSLYDARSGEMRLIKAEGEIEALQRYVSKLYNLLGWPITIKEAINGIDINKTNITKNPFTSGNTLLHKLILADASLFSDKNPELEKENVIKKLLDNSEKLGLRVNKTNRYDGKTALDLAIEKGLLEVESILTELSEHQRQEDLERIRKEGRNIEGDEDLLYAEYFEKEEDDILMPGMVHPEILQEVGFLGVV